MQYACPELAIVSNRNSNCGRLVFDWSQDAIQGKLFDLLIIYPMSMAYTRRHE